MNSEVSQESLDRVILEIAISTVHLEAVIDDIRALICGEFLGHSAVHGVVGVASRDEVGTVSNHESRGFEIGGHLGKLELDVLVGCYGLAKLLSTLDVVSSCLNACSSTTERATRDIQTTSIQA